MLSMCVNKSPEEVKRMKRKKKERRKLPELTKSISLGLPCTIYRSNNNNTKVVSHTQISRVNNIKEKIFITFKEM